MKNITIQIKSTMLAPILSVLNYGLIAGFALTGLGIMALSALVWAIFSSSVFSGFGLLTGGILLVCGFGLFLGKLAKTEDALYDNLNREKKPETT